MIPKNQTEHLTNCIHRLNDWIEEHPVQHGYRAVLDKILKLLQEEIEETQEDS